jgi:hypothetical protein
LFAIKSAVELQGPQLFAGVVECFQSQDQNWLKMVGWAFI